jgi:hypothetical protein
MRPSVAGMIVHQRPASPACARKRKKPRERVSSWVTRVQAVVLAFFGIFGPTVWRGPSGQKRGETTRPYRCGGCDDCSGLVPTWLATCADVGGAPLRQPLPVLTPNMLNEMIFVRPKTAPGGQPILQNRCTTAVLTRQSLVADQCRGPTGRVPPTSQAAQALGAGGL